MTITYSLVELIDADHRVIRYAGYALEIDRMPLSVLEWVGP
jgi:hypothetical protein